EVSRTVVVRPDGFITLPLIDNIAAAGLASSELRAKGREALERRLGNPEGNVIALATRPPMGYVGGGGKKAKAPPFRGAATAMQAISAAGGLRRSGSASHITLIRLGEDGHLKAIPITQNAKGQVAPYVALESTFLQPDDVIFVPESGRSAFA